MSSLICSFFPPTSAVEGNSRSGSRMPLDIWVWQSGLVHRNGDWLAFARSPFQILTEELLSWFFTCHSRFYRIPHDFSFTIILSYLMPYYRNLSNWYGVVKWPKYVPSNQPIHHSWYPYPKIEFNELFLCVCMCGVKRIISPLRIQHYNGRSMIVFVTC
jgi:hypothetical protein